MNQEEEVLAMIDTMDTAVLDADEWLIGVMAESFASKDALQDERG